MDSCVGECVPDDHGKQEPDVPEDLQQRKTSAPVMGGDELGKHGSTDRVLRTHGNAKDQAEGEQDPSVGDQGLGHTGDEEDHQVEQEHLVPTIAIGEVTEQGCPDEDADE